MGITGSKHIQFLEAKDLVSSKEFKLRRKMHYKNEFKVAKDTYFEEEQEPNQKLLTQIEKDSVVKSKHPTFLEPPQLHDDFSRDLFKKRSLRSEINEFTYAKEKLEKKRSKRISKMDKSHESNEKTKHRHKKKSGIRNKSHDPPPQDDIMVTDKL